MARGIKLPTEVENGRLKMISGDAYIQQLVMVALGDNYSENPFQDLGLGEFMIFDLNDSPVEGEIRKHVESVFESLEEDQLASLKELTFSSEGEEKRMFLVYENLETGDRPEMEVPIPTGGE